MKKSSFETFFEIVNCCLVVGVVLVCDMLLITTPDEVLLLLTS